MLFLASDMQRHSASSQQFSTNFTAKLLYILLKDKEDKQKH